jgi:hypothetical protein
MYVFIIFPTSFIFITAVWFNVAKRRSFFENYAKANGFDPLIAENWYMQSPERIESMKVN